MLSLRVAGLSLRGASSGAPSTMTDGLRLPGRLPPASVEPLRLPGRSESLRRAGSSSSIGIGLGAAALDCTHFFIQRYKIFV